MGSCCVDGRLVGDSVSLEDGDREGFDAQSNEFNGGGCDQILEVDLRDNESREGNLGREGSERKCQRVQGPEGEGEDLELEMASVEVSVPDVGSEGCDVKHESERVGGSINSNVGVDTVYDFGVHGPDTECRVDLRVEQEADVAVFNNGFECCEADDCNHCSGVTSKRHHADRENEPRKLVSALKEAEEDCQGGLLVKKENVHLRSERLVEVDILHMEEFDHCQLLPAFANVDFADQSLVVEVSDNVASVDSGRVPGDLIPGRNNDEEECPGYLGPGEARECLGLAQKFEGESREPVIERKHDKFLGSSPLRMLQGNCFTGSTYEKAGVSKDINTGANLQSLEVGSTDNVVSVDSGIGCGGSVSVNHEAKEAQPGGFGAEEEIGHRGSNEALIFEPSKPVSEAEPDEFPGLSPLRTLGGGGFACSVFGIGSEVGLLSSGMFDRKRGKNGCGDDELLVSSGLGEDWTLVKVNKDVCKSSNGHNCHLDAPHDCEESCSTKRCKELHCFKAEKVNFGRCNLNAVCLNEGIKEGNTLCLRIDQSLPLHYVGLQKEHCKDNITGHYHKDVSCGEEINHSMQCAPDKVAPCDTAKGLAFRKQSELCTFPENISRKLSLLPDFHGSEANAFMGTSSSCSNVNCSHGEADNGGRRYSSPSPTIVLRRSNPKRGASLRCNLADRNHDQLSRTRNNRRNRRKSVDVISTFLFSTIKIYDKLTRKRSCPRRLARPSVWGSVENIIKIFEKNVSPANYDTDMGHIQNKRSKKGRSTVGSQKLPKSQKDGHFQVSSAKDSATSDQPVFNVVIGAPTSDCLIDYGNGNEDEAAHKLSGDELAVAVKMLKGDMQLGDRDMDSSLTQEASVEMGECPGVSSQMAPNNVVETIMDMNSLDPGTSPDSDVYHPVIDVGTTTSEGNNSADQAIETKDVGIVTIEDASLANQFGRMGRNVFVLESVSEDGLPSPVSIASRVCVAPSSVLALDPNLSAKAKNRRMNGQLDEQPHLGEDLSIVEKLHGPQCLNRTKKPSRCSKSRLKKQDVSNKKNRASSESIKKTTRKGSKCKSFALVSSGPGTFEFQSLESIEVQNRLDEQVLAGEDANNSQSESPLTAKARWQKLPRGTKPGRHKGRLHCRETIRQQRHNAHVQMDESVQKSDNMCSTEKKKSQTVDLAVEANHHISFSSGTVNPTLALAPQQNCSKDAPEDKSNLLVTPVDDKLAPNESKTPLGQPLPPQVAWVLCDDCEKWRCISVELANALEETKCKWTCKDNTDKAFADCSIPQEKTNAEINAELGILDEEDPSSAKASTSGIDKLADVATSQRAPYIPIKSNVFLHRNRKTQTIDEVMVCHCQPPLDGHRGCGDRCLNRMLNIECVKGTCPCGDLCSNQRFQKRKYAKFKCFSCGKKGCGLQLQQDVSQGQFLIEYVGEVLDIATYEARQRLYASRGQKHFYFMALNGGEVIDAYAKGNLGRYINHSCEPNCRTEKWMVNGEVCIGLFAIRDIKKGEEVTFDYNYVRVVGAAAKKCVCGSSECRGYIGGDLLNSEIIVQGDSDEEDIIEPVMIRKNCKMELTLDDSMSNTNDGMVAKNIERCVERKEIVDTCPLATEVCLENKNDTCRTVQEVNPLAVSLQSIDSIQSENTIFRPLSGIQSLTDSKQSLNSVQAETYVCKPTSDVQMQETSLQASTSTNEAPSDFVLSNKKSKANFLTEKPVTAKPHSITKSSRTRGTIKRDRSGVKNSVSQKTTTLTPGTSQSEGVEGKLNELLNTDGGISKQKDATRGYLKLLFVTAAEGDVGGCASQSTRDLSLILDAILKTKSRKVLVDIINKNGLQMLHNILKQNRGNFNRIPIIRKLLKVLEFLALAGILTRELINKDPPCNGMESFKESILKLANHSEKQVYKIAREFRDKWIPRNIRRIEPSDRDGGPLVRQHPYRCRIQSSNFKCHQGQAARDTDAIVITAEDHLPASPGQLGTPGETSPHSHQVSISASTDSSLASGTQPRKRKSRWDRTSDVTSADMQSLWPSEDQIWETGPKFMKCKLASSDQTAQLEVLKQTCGTEREGSSWGEVTCSHDLMQLDDERPPGFLDDGPSGFFDDGPPGFLTDGPPGFLDSEGPPGFLTDGPPGFLDSEGPPGFLPLQKNCNSQFSSENALVTCEVFTGHPQEIYLSHMPLSFGIPVGLVQQLRTSETGGNPCYQNWAVAPGMPFYPFPPLPSYPRGQPNHREGRQQARPVFGTDITAPSTSGGMLADTIATGSRNSRLNGRLRWPNNDCGRRFHRHQMSNNREFQRCWPRWPHQRFGRGFRGNIRVGPYNLEQGNVRRDFTSALCPSDGVNKYDGLCPNFQQQHN